MGLDVYLYRYENLKTALADSDGEHTATKIERPSALHPDHYFKVGYFRSSYNASGIDQILSDRIGTTLAGIMGVSDGYIVVPDWSAARQRAIDAKARLAAYFEQHGMVMVVDADSIDSVNSKADALAAYNKRHKSSDGWYSNRAGMFFAKESPTVRAVFTGLNWMNRPTAYLVIDAPDFDYYLQALDIVAETCEWVLAQPDIDAYALHWSS